MDRDALGWWTWVSALLCLAAPGCTLLGVGDLDRARCASDDDCAPFNAGLPDDACRVFACDEAAGACVTLLLDVDADGEPSERCGGGDCDDDDETIGPGATEVCGNLVDEDCSGAANDLDCDGSDALADGGDDCDDGNASIGPHVAEVCNGVDDDCNEALDAPDEDDDGDGSPDACAGAAARDCDDQDPNTHLGAPELCDGVDNDCTIDGVSRIVGGSQPEPAEDRDGDGHVTLEATCLDVAGGYPRDDCDDHEARAYPGLAEVCDGLDNDCDGGPDDEAGGEEPGAACRPVDVSVGRSHTCALRADGAVVCWGSNSIGELGLLHASGFDAALVTGLPPAEQVVAGAGFSCALVRRVEGGTEVACWGQQAFVSGGSAARPDFAVVPGLEGASAISAGEHHACAILDGEVWCWGTAERYQLDGETLGSSVEGLAPRPVPGLDSAVQVGAGGFVSCAVRANGEVVCWGLDDEGQLGDAAAGDHGVATVAGIDDALEVSCGERTCCAVRELDGGSLWCWGYHAENALGCDHSAPDCPSCAASTPVRAGGALAGVEHVSVGSHGGRRCADLPCYAHGMSCAWDAAGEAWCWGLPDWAEVFSEEVTGCTCAWIGTPTWSFECATVPTRYAAFDGATARSVGWNHGCVVATDQLLCRGANERYQLGVGLTFESSPPSEPASVMAAAMQTSGECFRMPDLSVRCAADGAVREVALPADAIDLSVGDGHRCLVESGASVRCSGDGTVGQLGTIDGEEGTVAGLRDAARVACGGDHCCALRRTGHVECWGDDAEGQLGAPGLEDRSCNCSRVPLAVDGLGGVRQVVAGRVHSCAVTWGGEVFCWGGDAQGQAGSGDRRDVPAPRPVEGLPAAPVVALAASPFGDTTCAALETGGVRCWGAALDPETPGGSDPWSVPGMDTAVQLAMSATDLCARLASGAVRCFGASGWDPSRVIDARDLGCGRAHCCLTRTSGQSLCWGEAPAGLLGPDLVSTATPLPVENMLGD